MNPEIVLVFPHQLFQHHPCLNAGTDVVMVEEFLFFKQYNFHQQKIKLHRASMQFYKSFLQKKGFVVHYIDSQDERNDIRNLIPDLAKSGVKTIHTCDPTDDWLNRRMRTSCKDHNLILDYVDTPMFINTVDDVQTFFAKKKRFFQTEFYIDQRKRRNILIDKDFNPIGVKWSFDDENRLKYPKNSTPPQIKPIVDNVFDIEAKDYVRQHFSTNVGSCAMKYPTTFAESEAWLETFFVERFHHFGHYEDAMLNDQSFLHHSILTPMLNIGLLLPQDVIDKAIAYADKNDIPINSLEGFVRQILGWREFIRAVYILKGSDERVRNFWEFDRSMPVSFYDGSTGLKPVDAVIKRLLSSAYSHHIERLMILGNIMVLSEIHPDAVYKWFMEMYIDAYDWVMVPNVYGMSQFADGGLMATKPYISGSNYLMKMSNFEKGPWQEHWDALFWRFLDVHRTFFLKNPRLSMLVRTYDKWDESKKQLTIAKANHFLEQFN